MIGSSVILLLAYPLYFVLLKMGLSDYNAADIFYMLLCAVIAVEFYSKEILTTKNYLDNLVSVCYGATAFVYLVDLVLDNVIRTKFPIAIIFGGATIGLAWSLTRHLWRLVRQN